MEGDLAAGAGLRDAYAAAGALNVNVTPFGVRRPYNFETAFAQMARQQGLTLATTAEIAEPDIVGSAA